jgi:hypothetical protein
MSSRCFRPTTSVKVSSTCFIACEKLLADAIQNLQVRDVEADEIWGFVGMKENAKANVHDAPDTLGEAYTYVAMERNSKLILSCHLGKRNRQDTLQLF